MVYLKMSSFVYRLLVKLLINKLIFFYYYYIIIVNYENNNYYYYKLVSKLDLKTNNIISLFYY